MNWGNLAQCVYCPKRKLWVQFHLFMRINGCRVISFIYRHFAYSASWVCPLQLNRTTNKRIILVLFLWNIFCINHIFINKQVMRWMADVGWAKMSNRCSRVHKCRPIAFYVFYELRTNLWCWRFFFASNARIQFRPLFFDHCAILDNTL